MGFRVLIILGLGLLSALSPAVRGADDPVGWAVTNRWSFPTRFPSQAAPAIGKDGTIYVTTAEGKLFSITPQGRQNWVFAARSGIEIHSSPAIAADNTIYFGSRDRHFYAIDSTGKLKWAFRTGAWVDSSAALGHDGTVYFGSWDHSLYALGAAGNRKWAFDTGAPITASPVITTNGTICIGSHSGRFYAFNPEGTPLWEYATGAPVLSSTAIGPDGALYFTSVNGFLHALNPGGSLRWRLHTGSITRSTPVIAPDGALYLGVNKELWCVSAAGARIWERGNEAPIEAAPIAHEDRSASYLHGWGVLMCLDRQRAPLWGFQTGGPGEAVAAMGTNGTVYICASANLMARGPVQPMARSSWPCFRGNRQNTGNALDNPEP